MARQDPAQDVRRGRVATKGLEVHYNVISSPAVRAPGRPATAAAVAQQLMSQQDPHALQAHR